MSSLTPSSTLGLSATSTTTTVRPTGTLTRTPSEIEEGLRIWAAPPSPTRNLTAPFSRYARIAAPFPYYIRAPDLGLCPPEAIDSARQGRKINPSLFDSCGVDDLELALRLCDVVEPRCANVVDSNSTFSWRERIGRGRYLVVDTGFAAFPVRDFERRELFVDYYFSHFVRVDTNIYTFPSLQASIGIAGRSGVSVPRRLPVLLAGLTVSVPPTLFQVTAPVGTLGPIADPGLAIVASVHALVLLLLGVAFFQRLYKLGTTPGEEYQWEGLVLAELSPGGGRGVADQEAIPAYTPHEVAAMPLQSEGNKRAGVPARTDVMHI
ncbi:hypothetical protein HDU96_010172 [Phlyctochytrium bullatum]|nr:hypothetical protein HDU96_010172 [Phlyctochytrium bullatum]